MAKKYDLVGSVYNRYAKENKYQEEEVVKTFSSLEEVDKFTSSFKGSYDLSRNLDPKYQNKTLFSIRIINSNNTYTYKSVIYDKKDLAQIIDSLIPKTVAEPYYHSAKIIRQKNDLFLKSFKEVETKIIRRSQKDQDDLYAIFGNNKLFSTLLNRYFRGDTFDSEITSLQIALERAFLEYEVFRHYLANKDKEKTNDNKKINDLKIAKTNFPQTTVIIPHDFSSYSFDSDKEEFLSEEEISFTYGEDEDIENYRRRRR